MPGLSAARAKRATATRYRCAALFAASTLLVGATQDELGRPFDPRTDRDYGDARPAITAYLERAVPRPSGSQHFCAIAYRYAANNTAVWVHWVEGNGLILWEPQGLDEGRDLSLVHSRRDLDLNTDVLPTRDGINSSTYLIDRAWLDQLLSDCDRHGARYTVTAPPRTSEGGE